MSQLKSKSPKAQVSRIPHVTLTRPAVLLLAALARWHRRPPAGRLHLEFPSQLRLRNDGWNAYLNLSQSQLYLSNKACKECVEEDGPEELWITVLPKTRVITFPYAGKLRTVRTRVLEEYETADGEVEEVSNNFVADCDPTNDVYYFGETVFDGGNRWMTPGSRAGTREAGILMRTALPPGSRTSRNSAEREDRANTRRGFRSRRAGGHFKRRRGHETIPRAGHER